MSFHYLISHRLKPKALTYPWFKVWGKRLFTFHSLIALSWRNWRWKFKGVKMGNLAGIGKCKISGNHSRLSVGDFSFIGRADIQVLSTVSIGSNVVINDDVTIVTGTHDVNDAHFQLQEKPVSIGDYAWICTGSLILPGVTIGKGGVVAAGAVVSKDVAPFTVVAGNPARVVRENRNQALDYKPNLLRACLEAWVGVPYQKK